MYTYIRETVPENNIDLILDLLNPTEHRYVFYLTILHKNYNLQINRKAFQISIIKNMFFLVNIDEIDFQKILEPCFK